MTWMRLVALPALAAALAGCGAAAHPPARAATTPASAAPTPTPAASSPTPTATAAPAASPRQSPAAAPVRSTPAPRATTSTAPPLLVDRLDGVGDARQVIAVTAPSYGSTYATLSAFERTGSGWRQVFGPWSARVGYNGFAPPGQKREGDGRSPTGSYGFQFFFGVEPSPGVAYPYRRVTGANIVWDDDPASANYNEWVDENRQSAGRAPEPMDQQPAYDYGAVIAYNTARTPGLGSAIFLHVSTGGSTAGCVSVAQADLLDLLRWLRPQLSPRIVMGVYSAVTH